MSFIHCTCDCQYQNDGYCELEKAAQVTNCSKTGGCLHYVPKKKSTNSYGKIKGK